MQAWNPKIPSNSPLTLHPRGYVAFIAGKTRWVCGKKPHAEALDIYHRKARAFAAGAAPLPIAPTVPADNTRVQLADVLRRWLVDRAKDAEGGKIGLGSYRENKLAARYLDIHAGNLFLSEWTPDTTRAVHERLSAAVSADFARRAITQLRACLHYAEDMEWCQPVRLGRIVRQLVHREPPAMRWKLYSPAEIARILEVVRLRMRSDYSGTRDSATQFYAMCLLALNGGMGARECAELRRECVDLDNAIIDFNRGKTGAQHIVPLWVETRDALRVVMEQRPGDDLVFRTREGNCWCREEGRRKNGKLASVTTIDNVSAVFTAICKDLGIKRPRESFYKLKHLSAGVADEAGDPHATFVLFGHKLPGVKSHYVSVGIDRLRKVVSYMRHKLLIEPAGHTESPVPGAVAATNGGTADAAPPKQRKRGAIRQPTPDAVAPIAGDERR